MFVYSGTRYTAEHVGEVVVEVEYDRCQCEYFYVLARMGVGRDDVYGFGSSRARRSAENQSSKEMAHRLLSEAELVPCPKCHWINDTMIEGYRRSRFRILGHLATWIAAGGTMFSLLIGLIGLLGDPKNRGNAWLYLVRVALPCRVETWVRRSRLMPAGRRT